MTDLLVKWPSRARAALVRKHFPLWNHGPVRFIFSVDEDDGQLPEYLEFLHGRQNVRVVVGRSPNKVHAINRDLDGEPFSVLALASDDFLPQRADWAERILSLMRAHFPDGDGMLHFNDGRNGRTLNTFPVMGQKFYSRTGYVYHPDYRNLWCDNEQQEVAERLGRSQYVDEVLCRHAWVDVTGRDATHLRSEATYHEDQATFERRRRLGFPR
jgi:hypothetical protein